MSTTQSTSENDIDPTLDDLSIGMMWVAWRAERRGPKDEATKVPYSPYGGKAKADDPETWGTRAEAEAAIQRLGYDVELNGGVGIELTDLVDGWTLGGVDLDTCLDGDTGEFAHPWASELVALLCTYTEVSPSGTGAKSFFRYRVEDLEALKKAAGITGRWGRTWKMKGGKHPPGIELYLGGRYFAVTDNQIGDIEGIAPVDVAKLTQLVAIASTVAGGVAKPGGAEIIQLHGMDAAKKRQEASGAADGMPRDGSRSGMAYHWILDYRRRNIDATFTEMVAAIHDPETLELYGKAEERPGITEWLAEKGDDRQLQKPWEKCREDAERLHEGDQRKTEVELMVEAMNKDYFVVNEGGKTLVFREHRDEALNRKRYDLWTFEDFRRAYQNTKVITGFDAKGNPRKPKTHAEVWLDHPDRRQFLNGVVFDPTGKQGVDDGRLNLWDGFAYAAGPGCWNRFKDHLLQIICCGNQEHYDYLLKTMARAMQHPEKLAEVAVVMRGKEGVGKSMVANAMMRLFGQHGFKIASSIHLVGRFNGHLQDCCLLFADEAFFAGDKAGEGVLKALITEEILPLEDKNRRMTQGRNCLHIWMSTNAEWAVPTSLDSRRFFVLDVSDARKGDTEYFKAIVAEMENGGYGAMLYDLLREDLADFDHRRVPETNGLNNQRLLSLEPHYQWWVDILTHGTFDGVEWLDKGVTTQFLHKIYRDYVKAQGRRFPIDVVQFGKFLRSIGGWSVRPHKMERGYRFGTLGEARATFLERTALRIDWDDGAEEIPVKSKRKKRPQEEIRVDGDNGAAKNPRVRRGDPGEQGKPGLLGQTLTKKY